MLANHLGISGTVPETDLASNCQETFKIVLKLFTW